MKKNKYLLLLSSLGTLILLVGAAVQENFGKDWRKIQATAHSDEGPIPVQLRQIVNGTLRTSDRCVSCHVAMGPGEQSVTGSPLLVQHKKVVHDPAEYGCAICHGGQGQATEKEAAHGEVEFWPEPMLPASRSYAGCGTCHATLHVPNHQTYLRARATFERLDCRTCHRVNDRGGTVRPGGGSLEGPDLSRVGLAGYAADWYPRHLQHVSDAPSATAPSAPPSAWKTAFAPASGEDQAAVKTYLDLLVGAPQFVEAKSVFNSSGCLGCHKISGVGGDEATDLSRAGERDPGQLPFHEVAGRPTLENWLGEHFRSPSGVVANSRMPALAVSDQDIDWLTFYVLSLRRRELPSTYVPRDRVRATKLGEREYADDGATLFGTFCAGCHGPKGLGRRSPGMPSFPSIASPGFLALASDDFLIATIRQGRPGRRMPGWERDGGLTRDDIAKVVAWLRETSGTQAKPDPKPRRWVETGQGTADKDLGKRLYAASCSGCHGEKGQGIEGPALNNQILLANATDTFLAETISGGREGTSMQGFLAGSSSRRSLSPQEIEAVIAFIRTWEVTRK